VKRLVDAYEIGAIEIGDLKTRSEHIRARIERAQRELADAERRLREIDERRPPSCTACHRLNELPSRRPTRNLPTKTARTPIAM